MKKLNLIIIILILFAAISNLYTGDKIKIKLHQPPPNKLGTGDLWKLDITNLTHDDIKIILSGNLSESKEGLIVQGRSKVFTVKPGKKTYGYDDFKSGEVNWKNKSYQEVILRTGNVKEGNYTICVTALFENGDVADQENCIEQSVQQMSSITLITPEDKAELDPDKLPGMVFSWTPLPGAGNYTLRIVELKGSQSPDEAFRSNQPIFEKELRTTTYQGDPIHGVDVKLGMKLAWQVSSGDVKSEISVFSMKKRKVWDDDIQNENGWLELADTIYYKPRPGHKYWWTRRRWDTLVVNIPGSDNVETFKPRPGHKHWWSGKRWDTLIVNSEPVDNNNEVIWPWKKHRTKKSGWDWDTLMITSPVGLENHNNSNIFFTFKTARSIGLHQKTVSKYFIVLEDPEYSDLFQDSADMTNKEFIVLQSEDNPELENAYLFMDPVKGLIHKYRWSNNDPKNPNLILTQAEVDNIDFTNITLQALDGYEKGLKFVHAYSDSLYSVSSWVLPTNTGLNEEPALEESLAKHKRVWSWIHKRDKSECDNVPKNRKIRLIDNSGTNKESIVTYELMKDGTYGFRITENIFNQNDVEGIKYDQLILLDIETGLISKHCYLYTKCDKSNKPKK